MSGSGRARASSFAEPTGAPGSAVAGAGSAVGGGSSTGKTGASQASGSSSSSIGNFKLPSEYIFKFLTIRLSDMLGRLLGYSVFSKWKVGAHWIVLDLAANCSQVGLC